MQFGICLPIADAGIAHAAGFDFVEPTVRSLSPLDPDFDAIRAPFDSAPLPTPVFNVFVPSEVPVTGPNVNWEQVESYLEAAIGRVAAVGGEKIVFGSGGARNVPDGFDKEEAFMQLVRFLRLAGNVAVRNGVTIVIEPLNSRDSNIQGRTLVNFGRVGRVGRRDLGSHREAAGPQHTLEPAERGVPGPDRQRIAGYQRFVFKLHDCRSRP